MYIIHKKVEDEIEYLPDVTETPLMEGDITTYSNKTNLATQLYQAIAKRENYYQFNSAPVFVDPEYARYSGIVTGILIGSGYEEVKTDTSIIIQKNGRKLLVIDRIQRRSSYYEEQKEIESLLNSWNTKQNEKFAILIVILKYQERN